DEGHHHEQHDVRIGGIDHRCQADDLAGYESAEHRAGEGSDAADDDHYEGLHQDRLPHVRRDRHDRRIDDAGEARCHGADSEHQHEYPLDIDPERTDHHRILDARAHDHADT